MKLKIVSDGTFEGTKLIDTQTGDILHQVVDITYEASVKDFPRYTATIKIANIEVDITSRSEIEQYRTDRQSDYEFVRDATITRTTSIVETGDLKTQIIDVVSGDKLGCVQTYWWNCDAMTGKCSSRIKQFLLDRHIAIAVEQKSKSFFQIVIEKLFPKKV